MKVKCNTCNVEFDKPDYQMKKTKQNFCTRRCSNIKSNENRWKNHITIKEKYKCDVCGKRRDYRTKHKMCELCYSVQQRNKNKLITIGEIKRKHNERINGKWYSAEIRNYARTWNSDLINTPCQKCKYDTHSELCHIKAIKDFDDKSILGDINDPKNIVVLCPNHHWEFDNGTLKISDIPTR
jgi:hypothetical protein